MAICLSFRIRDFAFASAGPPLGVALRHLESGEASVFASASCPVGHNVCVEFARVLAILLYFFIVFRPSLFVSSVHMASASPSCCSRGDDA